MLKKHISFHFLLLCGKNVLACLRCLDEWDVFLDEVSRARVERLLLSQTRAGAGGREEGE